MENNRGMTVFPLSDNVPLKIAKKFMDLDWTYLNWGKRLHSISKWNPGNFKQAGNAISTIKIQ